MFSVIDLQYTHVSIIFNINNYKSCPRQKDVFYHIKCFFVQRYLFPESRAFLWYHTFAAEFSRAAYAFITS